MAKQHDPDAPGAAAPAAAKDEFRSETRPGSAPAPITATATATVTTTLTAPVAAKPNGPVITEVPTDKIDADAMIRDRTVLDEAEMTELKLSIRTSGLRLPVELCEDGQGGYALISGYRRLRAVRELAELSSGENFQTIAAIIRPAKDAAGAFASMVEENEIRAGLSPFERGRIAVIAAQAGAFVNTEDAVSQLFAAASKAKRSKLRSFAEIYEMLGDVLQHPEALSERRGLRLAGALRQGGESRLRDALSAASSRTAEREWAALETVVAELEAGSKNRARRRRPGSVPVAGWRSNDTLHLSSGVTLQRGHDSKGYVIRISGRGATADMVESAMEELRSLFEA